MHIGTKCSKMPCIIEYKDPSGEWDCAVFDDDGLRTPTIFVCEHDAFEQVAIGFIAFMANVAMGKCDPEDMPRIENFRFTQASGHAFKEPVHHDDYVPNVDMAKRLISKIMEGL